MWKTGTQSVERSGVNRISDTIPAYQDVIWRELAGGDRGGGSRERSLTRQTSDLPRITSLIHLICIGTMNNGNWSAGLRPGVMLTPSDSLRTGGRRSGSWKALG